MHIDLFYKTYAGDYPFLKESLKSVKKHAKGFRNVILVTDYGQADELNELVEGINLPSLKIIELERTQDIYQPTKLPRPLLKFKRSCLKAISSSRRVIKEEKIGYEIQKAVKCDWTKWSDADAIFQVDSDMILTSRLSTEQLFMGPRPVWLRRSWKTSSAKHIKYWKHGNLWFYKLKESDFSYMTSPGFLLTRELTEAFKCHVETHYGCSLYRLFSNPRFPSLSEYELLGLFAELNHLATPYHFEDQSTATSAKFKLPMKQFWSWGGLTDDIQLEILGFDKK